MQLEPVLPVVHDQEDFPTVQPGGDLRPDAESIRAGVVSSSCRQDLGLVSVDERHGGPRWVLEQISQARGLDVAGNALHGARPVSLAIVVTMVPSSRLGNRTAARPLGAGST